MKRYMLITALIIASFIFPPAASAQSIDGIRIVSSQEVGRELTFDVKGDTRGKDIYIGCSFYPKSYEDRYKEGAHYLVSVTGPFNRRLKVPEIYYEGMFEVALWGKLVKKSECSIVGCFSCEKFGHHPEEMIDCCSGYLLPVGSVSLKISIGESDDWYKFTANAQTNNGDAWLGASFYLRNCKDKFKDAIHDTRQVRGCCEGVWKVPRKFKGGTYEIAVWKKKVEKGACETGSCSSCEHLGYHMWWLLMLKTGKIKE